MCVTCKNLLQCQTTLLAHSLTHTKSLQFPSLSIISNVADIWSVSRYLLTPWCRVLPEQITGLQLLKKFPTFHGTRMFITAFTNAHHLSISWASSIQSIPPHPTSWRSMLILSSHLRLGFPSGCLSLRFPHENPVYTSPVPIRATSPAHQFLLNFTTRTTFGEQYRSLSSSLCSFLHSPVTSSLLAPTFPSTPYSQTPSSYVPPSMWATKFRTQTTQK